MRIALLAPFGVQPKGTVQARILPLARALAERGHMVRVVIPPWDDPAVIRGDARTDSVCLMQGADGVAGVHTVTLQLPERTPYSVALTRGLVGEALHPGPARMYSGPERELAAFRTEVAHVFKPVGYSGLAGFALSGLRVPWVLDVDDWEGRGGWADVNRYSGIQRLSILLMEALLPRMAGAVTAASKTLEARAWNMGIPRRRVVYMPNGVSREKYASWTGSIGRSGTRAELGLGDNPVVLLYTRFDVFPVEWPLLVMKRVLADHPTAKLLVVGRGFGGEEDRLLSEAEQMGIRHSLVMAGYVEGDQLPTYLAAADVCIYPMRDTLLNRSKSPMKVLEPMVAGLPVVAHRVGEDAQFIGDAGVLVAPGSLVGMAVAVTSLLSNPERRAYLGAQAQRRVWEQFDWAGLSARVERAYGVGLGAV